jgi:hypothetical protein
MAIDPDVARVILEAHMEGDNCPEVDEIVFRQKMTDDLQQIRATLVAVRADRAEWVLEGGEKIYVTSGFSRPGTDEHDALEPGIFRQWMHDARETLVQNGRDPHHLAMAGLLSLSCSARLIVGWQEDYTDEDSALLAIYETMDE